MDDEVIVARNLRKEYGEKYIKVTAIKDVSLKVKKGEVVLILGPSGSGKTTLLSMIGCILSPDRGEIVIDGENVKNMSEKELARIRREKIGFVFQGFNLLKSLTAQENVEVNLNLVGIKGEVAREKSAKILIELGLRDRIDFYTDSLSMGEKQRVSIARAIVSNTKIILADEPTGNLDLKNGQKIAQVLKRLAKEYRIPVIIVTHDNRIEGIADRILYLEDGIIKDEKIISS
jgi:putative ABC transport system ATP-binding protein